MTLTHSLTDNRILPDCNIKINPDFYFCNQLNKLIKRTLESQQLSEKTIRETNKNKHKFTKTNNK